MGFFGIWVFLWVIFQNMGFMGFFSKYGRKIKSYGMWQVCIGFHVWDTFFHVWNTFDLKMGNFFTKKWAIWPKNGHWQKYFLKLRTSIEIQLWALGIRSLSFLVHFLQPIHRRTCNFLKISIPNSQFFKNGWKLKK